MKFCKICNNILHININQDDLGFKCAYCNKIYSSDKEDTLRYEYSKKNNLGIYKKQLENLHNDPTNIEKFIDCPKCGHFLVKQIELTNDLKLFNVCKKCQHIWLYVPS